MPAPAPEVRRGDARFVTRAEQLVSRHSFSFGEHYDPDNVGFGPLVVLNEDVLEPGGGFDPHPHAGMEILTWVLDGALRYADSEARSGVAVPGRLQLLSSGRGITHSEHADGSEPAHYVQMWVVSDEPEAEPGYELRDVTGELAAGGLVVLASGRPGVAAVLPLRHRGATLHVARCASEAELELPDAPQVHVFVTGGSVSLDSEPDAEPLRPGDAVRLRDAGPVRLTAAPGSELLVWEFHPDVRPGFPTG